MNDKQTKVNSGTEEKPQDLKTTITVLELILRGLRWWKEWRDKRKAAK